MIQKSGFNLSTLRNRFQRLLILKFNHALINFIKFLFAALVHFCSVLVSKGKILCSTQLLIHGRSFKKKHFFLRWYQKSGVLTCLRLETDSNFYYFWSFTMHSISSSIFFLRPWCTLPSFYSKGARYSVHLIDSSLRDILKISKFFTVQTKKLLSTRLRLETGSNIYYFWNFTMH